MASPNDTDELHRHRLESALEMRLLFVRARILRLAAERTGPLRFALVRLAGLLALGVVLALVPAAACAQDAIRLAEILPALEGTELGALTVAPAPPPGGERSVTRAEVLRALSEAGRTAEGLDVPRATRIRRDGEHLDEADLTRLARPEIERVLSPCDIGELTLRGEMDLPAGERHIEVERPARVDSGALAFTVRVAVGDFTGRVSGQTVLRCPAPDVTAGQAVTARVAIGSVRVTASAVCREAGRVGDVIRVHVDETRRLVRARVIDASTVEVVR